MAAAASKGRMPGQSATIAVRGGGGISTGNTYIDRVLGQFQRASSSAQAAQRRNFAGALTGAQDLYSKYSPMVEATPGMYQDIAGRYGERTQNLLGNLEGLGEAQRSQLKTDYERDLKALTTGKVQDMINRGLTATTVQDREIEGQKYNLNQAYQQNLLNVNDAINRQRLDYESGLTGQELQAQALVPQSQMQAAQQGFQMGMAPIDVRMQRQDVGPDLSSVMSLAAMAGRGQAAPTNYPGVGSAGGLGMSRVDRMRAGMGGVGVAPLANVRTVGY